MLAFCIVLGIFSLFLCCVASSKNRIEISVELKKIGNTKEQDIQFEKSELDRWEKKATPVLDRFIAQYQIANNPKSDIQQVHNACVLCKDLWYQYHATQEGIHAWVHSKEYMRTYLGYLYHPAMYNIDDFKKHLLYTEQMCLLGSNKENVNKEIISLVTTNKEYMRCKLHKLSLCNATPLQVECCCRRLVEQKILAEYKKENRYYYVIAK